MITRKHTHIFIILGISFPITQDICYRSIQIFLVAIIRVIGVNTLWHKIIT